MAANPSGQGFQNKNRVAILAELDKEKGKLLKQKQSSTNHPGASIMLWRPSLNKDFQDHAEQQTAAQHKAASQHANAHSSGYFTIQDCIRILFFPFYLTLTQNEEHIRNENIKNYNVGITKPMWF
uniref:SOSS complex subunit C n=1 Tax=Equus asinus TaxID=9793 RepID=A0A8C4LD13_EQUAS